MRDKCIHAIEPYRQSGTFLCSLSAEFCLMHVLTQCTLFLRRGTHQILSDRNDEVAALAIRHRIDLLGTFSLTDIADTADDVAPPAKSEDFAAVEKIHVHTDTDTADTLGIRDTDPCRSCPVPWSFHEGSELDIGRDDLSIIDPLAEACLCKNPQTAKVTSILDRVVLPRMLHVPTDGSPHESETLRFREPALSIQAALIVVVSDGRPHHAEPAAGLIVTFLELLEQDASESLQLDIPTFVRNIFVRRSDTDEMPFIVALAAIHLAIPHGCLETSTNAMHASFPSPALIQSTRSESRTRTVAATMLGLVLLAYDQFRIPAGWLLFWFGRSRGRRSLFYHRRWRRPEQLDFRSDSPVAAVVDDIDHATA